jgi:hypothetical protein
MRHEVRRAFDEMTEAPHPSLRAAVRARLTAGREAQDSRLWRMAALGAALAVIAFVAAGSLYVLTRSSQPAPSPAGAGSPAPLASPTPSVSPAPKPSGSVTPSPPPIASNLPAFACTSVSGGGSASANVTDVRVGTAAGYDRIVIQFDGQVPMYTVTPQASSAFVADASGQTLQLQGSSGVKIVVHGASGQQTFTGSQDLKPGYPVLKEARQVGDFERVFSWGLGLSSPNCLRVFTLTGPDRLVIDVESP